MALLLGLLGLSSRAIPPFYNSHSSMHLQTAAPHVFAPLQLSQQRKQYVWETSWDKVADSMTVFIRYIKRPSAKSFYCSTDNSILSISLDIFHRIMYRTPTRGLWSMTRKRSKLMVRNPLNLQQIWEGKQLMMICHLLEIQWGWVWLCVYGKRLVQNYSHCNLYGRSIFSP